MLESELVPDPKSPMDVFSFIVGMTSALAWPMGLVVVVGMLRKHLVAAIGRLRSLKYGDAEASFAAELSAAQQTAAEHGVTVRRAATSFAPLLLSLANTSPTAAVIEAWKQVESELGALCKRVGVLPNTIAGSIEALAMRSLLPNGLDDILRQLARSRNRAVHESGENVSEGEAIEFMMLSKSVAERLRQIAAD